MRSTSVLVTIGLCALLLVAVNCSAAPPAVGQSVTLEITGDLAKRYHALQTRQPSPPGVQISASAQVVQKLSSGRFRVEHALTLKSKNGEPRLITLSAIVDQGAFTRRVVPRGAAVSNSPSDPAPVKSAKPIEYVSLNLSDPQGVTLRSWKLEKEVGK